MPDAIDRLTQSFLKFPGIGPRQAKRFVYYLLHVNQGAVSELLSQIEKLRASTRQCAECRRYFTLNSHPDNQVCNICGDPNRDASILMIVEKDIDLENIHKSGTYTGRYFVLGGLAPILEDNPERAIHASELTALVEKLAPGSALADSKLHEIIIALSVNPEGDYTVEILK